MCGRYMTADQRAAERAWQIHRSSGWDPSWNVAPTQQVPVILDRDGERQAILMRWGLVPSWAKGIPPKYSTINARAEGVESAPSYRGPWKRGQRCILPAGGFYEWQLLANGRKQPWFIHLLDQDVFGFAGLWDRSEAADGSAIESCTIITMDANPFMAQIHNTKARMPAILRREASAAWLAGSVDEARACLRQYPEAQMVAHTVSTAVNTPRNNRPELIEPAPAVPAG